MFSSISVIKREIKTVINLWSGKYFEKRKKKICTGLVDCYAKNLKEGEKCTHLHLRDIW